MADRHGATIEQVALAFFMARPGVFTVAKNFNNTNISLNAAAASIALSAQDFEELSGQFPEPLEKVKLTYI